MKDAPMFKIDERPQFTHTVTVRVPVDGGFDKQSMKVKYQLVSDKVTAEFDHRTLEGQKDFLKSRITSSGCPMRAAPFRRATQTGSCRAFWETEMGRCCLDRGHTGPSAALERR